MRINEISKRLSWLNKNIAAFSIASFLGDFSREMIIPLLPNLLITLTGQHNVASLLGIFMGVAEAAASLARLISGFLSDLVQKRKMFIVLGYALGAASGLLAFAYNSLFVFIVLLIAWIGRGVREPARDALIADSASNDHAGRSYGFQRAMDSLGALLGPLAMVALVPYLPLRALFLLSLIPALAAVAVIIGMVQEQQYYTVAGRSTIKNLLALNKQFLLFITVMLIFRLAFFNRVLLVFYAQEVAHIPATFTQEAWVLFLYSLFNAARMISEYVVGVSADMIGKKVTLGVAGFGTFLVVGIGMLLGLATPLLLSILFIVLGISTATVTVLEKVYAAYLLPEQSRATGFGIVQLVNGVGYLMSNIIIGMLWSYISINLASLYVIVITVISLLLLTMISVENEYVDRW